MPDPPRSRTRAVDDRSTALGLRRFGELKTAPASLFNLGMNAVTVPIPAARVRVTLICRKTAGSMRAVS